MTTEELCIGTITCRLIQPDLPIRAAVILLHGFAMDVDDLAPLAVAMGLPAALYFPRGPLEAAPRGRSWWPIDEERRLTQLAMGSRDLSNEYPRSRNKARAALMSIIEYAQHRHRDLPLFLAGFSQGGMLACDTVLHEDAGITGLALMSSSRIAINDWQSRLHKVRGLPVLVSHGRRDPDLSFYAGELLCESLIAAGADVTWLPFDGAHEIPLTVWRRFKRMVSDIL